MQRLTIVNLGIAISALAFQIFVLYPWHKELSQDFQEIQSHMKDILSIHKKD